MDKLNLATTRRRAMQGIGSIGLLGLAGCGSDAKNSGHGGVDEESSPELTPLKVEELTVAVAAVVARTPFGDLLSDLVAATQTFQEAIAEQFPQSAELISVMCNETILPVLQQGEALLSAEGLDEEGVAEHLSGIAATVVGSLDSYRAQLAAASTEVQGAEISGNADDLVDYTDWMQERHTELRQWIAQEGAETQPAVNLALKGFTDQARVIGTTVQEGMDDILADLEAAEAWYDSVGRRSPMDLCDPINMTGAGVWLVLSMIQAGQLIWPWFGALITQVHLAATLLATLGWGFLLIAFMVLIAIAFFAAVMLYVSMMAECFESADSGGTP